MEHIQEWSCTPDSAAFTTVKVSSPRWNGVTRSDNERTETLLFEGKLQRVIPENNFGPTNAKRFIGTLVERNNTWFWFVQNQLLSFLYVNKAFTAKENAYLHYFDVV